MKQTSFLMVMLVVILLLPLGQAVTTNTSISPVLVIGGKQGTNTGQFDEPDSVFVASDGRIYAGDTNNLRVQIFKSDGTYESSLTGFTPLSENSGNEVQGIGELSDGTIVVVEKAGFLYYFKDGSISKKVDIKETSGETGFIDTQGLAVQSDNDTVYVTNQPTHTAYKYTAEGTFLGMFYIGDSTTPENLIVDSSRKRLYVSVEGKGSIYAFDFNGTLISDFGKSDSAFNFEGLAIDPLGNILAVDEGSESTSSSDPSRIVIFDPDSFEAIGAWGGTSPGTEEGQFISPDGLAYDFLTDRVLIADQGNYRIQVFDYVQVLKTLALYDDSTAPTITVVSEITDPTDAENYNVTWKVADAENFHISYALSVNGTEVESGTFFGEKIISSAGSFDEPRDIKLEVTDAFGNTASSSSTIKGKSESTPTSNGLPLLGFITPIAVLTIRRKQN